MGDKATLDVNEQRHFELRSMNGEEVYKERWSLDLIEFCVWVATQCLEPIIDVGAFKTFMESKGSWFKSACVLRCLLWA